MNIEHQNRGHYPSSGSSNVTKSSDFSSKFRIFIDRFYAARSFFLISAIVQVALGVGVIFAALTGIVQSVLFSTLILMLASLNCITGCCVIFTLIHDDKSSEKLIRDAMRRIMSAQN